MPTCPSAQQTTFTSCAWAQYASLACHAIVMCSMLHQSCLSSWLDQCHSILLRFAPVVLLSWLACAGCSAAALLRHLCLSVSVICNAVWFNAAGHSQERAGLGCHGQHVSPAEVPGALRALHHEALSHQPFQQSLPPLPQPRVAAAHLQVWCCTPLSALDTEQQECWVCKQL